MTTFDKRKREYELLKNINSAKENIELIGDSIKKMNNQNKEQYVEILKAIIGNITNMQKLVEIKDYIDNNLFDDATSNNVKKDLFSFIIDSIYVIVTQNNPDIDSELNETNKSCLQIL